MPIRTKLYSNQNLMRGNILFIIPIMIIVIFSACLVGLFGFNKIYPSQQSSTTTTFQCCDSGNGDACKPQTDNGKTITYNGQAYGLLRSNVQLMEGNLHLQDTGKTTDDSNHFPIIVNSSQDHAIGAGFEEVNKYCGRPNPLTDKKDLYFKKKPQDPYMFMKKYVATELEPYCTSIKDDELIFACTKNCHAAACSFSDPDPSLKCYGTQDTVYNVYFRLADQQDPGVPSFIKDCDMTGLTNQQNGQVEQKLVIQNEESKENDNALQLKTFTISTTENNVVPWLSPLCKPAIYLYPEKQQHIHVTIAPQGKLTLTIPHYPPTGWNVVANPNGTIFSNNQTFPYLYYEAQIPDDEVNKQATTGYVVAYKDLANFFITTLPKLGLTTKETNDFANYWEKALPKFQYYKITLVPESLLSKIAPLNVSPTPQTTIRVTLYFTPLDKKIVLPQPHITNVLRKGFTVVEWGGMFKKDKNHPFTCLM